MIMMMVNETEYNKHDDEEDDKENPFCTSVDVNHSSDNDNDNQFDDDADNDDDEDDDDDDTVCTVQLAEQSYLFPVPTGTV